MLQQLPVELLLPIFSELRVVDLASVDQTCSLLHQIIASHSDSIHFSIAQKQGWLATQTAGDSGIYTPEDDLQESDLTKAIERQACALRTFASVRSWKDFTKKRFLLDRNWSTGCFQERAMYLGSCWRFKIDTGLSLIVYSGNHDICIAGLQPWAPEVSNRRLTRSMVFHAASPWTHVEYTAGTLIYLDFDGSFAILRRNAVGTRSFLHLPRAIEQVGDIHRPLPSIVPPSTPHCYKARWPYLIAGVNGPAGQIYVWRIDTCQLERTIDLQADIDEINYIELDEENIYVALDGAIMVYNRRSGVFIGNLAPSHSLANWSAIHHTSRHIVAISQNPGLLLIVWRTDSSIPWQNLAEASIVAELGPFWVTNLSVENNRCLFTIQLACTLNWNVPVYGSYQSLAVLELPGLPNTPDGSRSIPRTHLIVPICPSRSLISRVEMDGSAVYVTYNATDIASNSAVTTWYLSHCYRNFADCAWHETDSQSSIGPVFDFKKPQGQNLHVPASQELMEHFVEHGADKTSDTCYVYDFSPLQ